MVWSKDIRDLVVRKYEEIRKLRATARVLKMPKSSVSNILRYKEPEQDNRGGTKKLSDRKIARMIRIVRKLKENKERVTAAKVLKELEVDVSLRTIQRELKRQNFKYKRIRQ